MTSIKPVKSCRVALLHTIVGLAIIATALATLVSIGALFDRVALGMIPGHAPRVLGMLGYAVMGVLVVLAAVPVIRIAGSLGEGMLAAVTKCHASGNRMPPEP